MVYVTDVLLTFNADSKDVWSELSAEDEVRSVYSPQTLHRFESGRVSRETRESKGCKVARLSTWA
jgi:hypothetical protein